jgi:hypothetical protein
MGAPSFATSPDVRDQEVGRSTTAFRSREAGTFRAVPITGPAAISVPGPENGNRPVPAGIPPVGPDDQRRTPTPELARSWR